MEIEKIDQNFAKKETSIDGVVSYIVPCEPFTLYGVFYDEKEGCFMRMDEEVSKKVSEGVHFLNRNTSGGRLKFSTDSSVLKLTASYECLGIMPHMSAFGSSGFILLEERESEEVFSGLFAPKFTDEKGFSASVILKGEKMRDYVLYFPLYNDVKSLTLSFSEGAKVEKGKEYRKEKPILYAGSSITQGGCASRPDTSYPALISKWNKMDFINLGFSGNFKGEEAMADYIAKIDCSLFVYDYDHNAPTADHLLKTHYSLYEKFRRNHPKTPIIMISRPDGKWAEDGEERFAIIKETFERGKKEGDDRVYLIDGRTFYGEKNYPYCAVDNCHPTDLGFYFMARKIYETMILIDEKFK